MSYLENVKNKQDYLEALAKEEKADKINFKKFKDEGDFVEILLMSDEHNGANNYKKDLHMKVLEASFNKGRYIIHLGDAMETATRNSIGAGVYQQQDIIDKQFQNTKAIYEPFVDEKLMIGMHPGNHELRVFNSDGFNLTKQLCHDMKAKYLNIAKAHVFRVGNQTYTLYTTHGSSGARLPYTKIKGALDMEKIIDAEIYAMGHVHQLSHHLRNYNHIDLRTRQLKTKQKHFILTGSYLGYFGSYAQVKNMEPARLGSPIVRLYTNEHRIKVMLQ